MANYDLEERRLKNKITIEMTIVKELRKLKFWVNNLLIPSKRAIYKNIDVVILDEFQSRVNDGPFKGMKYIRTSNGSSLSPKIIGTYEKELHFIIEKIIETQYERIVDIGCAEGYYAVGLAFRLKNSKSLIYAYDTNISAIENLRKLAKLNDVEPKIICKDYFGHLEFEKFKNFKTFIICDIEGAEESLLDPSMSPSLLTYDILVEVHDGGDESSLIKDKLNDRFRHTHNLSLIKFSERNSEDYNKIKWLRDSKSKLKAVDELRVKGLEWMYMVKK